MEGCIRRKSTVTEFTEAKRKIAGDVSEVSVHL